jgi:hypothetical protein
MYLFGYPPIFITQKKEKRRVSPSNFITYSIAKINEYNGCFPL